MESPWVYRNDHKKSLWVDYISTMANQTQITGTYLGVY